MNEIVALDQLALEIRYYSQQASWSIIEVGKRLIEAKKRLSEDETWNKWLTDNVDFSKSTANKFIQCAERFSDGVTLRHLNPSKMIALLSLPESETETFIEQKKAEGNPVEGMTVKTLREEIKEWKSKAEQAKNEAFVAVNEKRHAELREKQQICLAGDFNAKNGRKTTFTGKNAIVGDSGADEGYSVSRGVGVCFSPIGYQGAKASGRKNRRDGVGRGNRMRLTTVKR